MNPSLFLLNFVICTSSHLRYYCSTCVQAERDKLMLKTMNMEKKCDSLQVWNYIVTFSCTRREVWVVGATLISSEKVVSSEFRDLSVILISK